jgi:hypothetical protein
MTTTISTKFRILSWDEHPYRENADGTKTTRADVRLGWEDGQGEAAFEALMHYRADGTSTYVTLMRVDGVLAGRRGVLVLRGTGDFDGTSARGGSTVVDAAGDLAGTTGTAESVSTHDDYPYMPVTFSLDLP